MVASTEPSQQLPIPPPAVVHRHIGQLLRELRLARRLLRLSQSAEDLTRHDASRPERKAVANAG
jgi:hypothetical protein